MLGERHRGTLGQPGSSAKRLPDALGSARRPRTTRPCPPPVSGRVDTPPLAPAVEQAQAATGRRLDGEGVHPGRQRRAVADLDADASRRRSSRERHVARVQDRVGHDLGDEQRGSVDVGTRCRRSRSRTNRRAAGTLSVVGGRRSSTHREPRGEAVQPSDRIGWLTRHRLPVRRRARLRASALRPALSSPLRSAPAARRGRAAAPGPESARSRRAGPAATTGRPGRRAGRGRCCCASCSSASIRRGARRWPRRRRARRRPCIGSPTQIEIATLVRPSRFGWPLVQTRCDPQMTVGSSGTPASAPSGRRRP